MLLEALLALTTVLPRIDAGIDEARARIDSVAWSQIGLQQEPRVLPYFSSGARAVSNWRDEAGGALLPGSLALVVKYSAGDPAFVARCVKLNNYWCIKQARWTGELGGDAEGHTGFATAADGADAAAMLLRRYYRDYGRRSALAIVRRWAPAECGLPRPAAIAMRGSSPRASSGLRVSSDIAPRGIGGTLRARFLAGRARGGAPRRVATTGLASASGLRVQPWSARARFAGHPRMASRAPAVLKPVADIATGIAAPIPAASPAQTQPARRTVSATIPAPSAPAMLVSTRPNTASSSRLARERRPNPPAAAADPAALLSPDRLVAESAALPSLVAGFSGSSLLDLRVPAPFCGNDETRIRNYAARIASSIGLKPDDDLGLFDPEGRPTERLAPVMLAMSWVELGSLRASPALVATAISRLAIRPDGATMSAADTRGTATR